MARVAWSSVALLAVACQDAGDVEDCPAQAAVGWSEASHGASGSPDAGRLFPADEVLRMDVTVCPAWFAMMTANLEDALSDLPADAPVGGPGGEPPEGAAPPADLGGEMPDLLWVPASVALDGRVWPYTGLRFKGNSSLIHSFQQGIRKLPLRLDLDQFEDTWPEVEDQRMWGFKKLTLNAGYFDPSLLRDRLVSEALDDAGIPAVRTASVALWVDVGDGPVYWGLYTLAEDPENDAFLDRVFGGDGGNLYQPETGCADWTCFDEAGFPKETNEDEADWSDVRAAVEALLADASDPEAWRAGLEATLDVDGFLAWLATNTAMGNWDSYGNLPHNYFLYGVPSEGGRLAWIPWDHNMALMEGMMPLLEPDLEEVDDAWPLIRRLLDDPVYAARYREHLAAWDDGLFAQDAFAARATALHDLVAPFAAEERAPWTQLESLEAFEDSVDGEDGLLAWMADRRARVEATLAR